MEQTRDAPDSSSETDDADLTQKDSATPEQAVSEPVSEAGPDAPAPEPQAPDASADASAPEIPLDVQVSGGSEETSPQEAVYPSLNGQEEEEPGRLFRGRHGREFPEELLHAAGYQEPPKRKKNLFSSVFGSFSNYRERLRKMSPKRRAVSICAVVAPVCALALLCVTIGFLVGDRTHRSASLSPTTDPSAPLAMAGSDLMRDRTQTPLPELTPTPEPTPTSEPHPSNMVIRQGIHAPFVIELQTRLMELYYMEDDEPTDYYGPVTEQAVRLFQRQHGLDVDGMVGMETYEALFADTAQHYTVMREASGSDVSQIQSRLRELGYLDSVTGYFGEKTEDAVKAFQKGNNLVADGAVGRQTREKLYSSDVQANFSKYSGSSSLVKLYQQRLKELGYLTTTPDGKYGNDTKQAVARFQEIHGLIPDGFLGYSTVQTLQSSSAKGNALQFGMSGDDVKNVQRYLTRLGYMGTATGYFGTLTEEAVKAFQQNNKIAVDGTVGPVTMGKLTASQAVASSSGTSSGTASSAQSSKIETFISVAQSKLGCSYVFASKGPNTFDCSGFVYYCLNRAGVNQSYMTSAGWAQTTKYQRISSMSSLKRGDVMVFSGTNYGHVGIYLGNGQMIHASSGKGKVVTSTGVLQSSYWTSHFICGYRIF